MNLRLARPSITNHRAIRHEDCYWERLGSGKSKIEIGIAKTEDGFRSSGGYRTSWGGHVGPVFFNSPLYQTFDEARSGALDKLAGEFSISYAPGTPADLNASNC